jgi:hypothetical protein
MFIGNTLPYPSVVPGAIDALWRATRQVVQQPHAC